MSRRYVLLLMLQFRFLLVQLQQLYLIWNTVGATIMLFNILPYYTQHCNEESEYKADLELTKDTP